MVIYDDPNSVFEFSTNRPFFSETQTVLLRPCDSYARFFPNLAVNSSSPIKSSVGAWKHQPSETTLVGGFPDSGPLGLLRGKVFPPVDSTSHVGQGACI